MVQAWDAYYQWWHEYCVVCGSRSNGKRLPCRKHKAKEKRFGLGTFGRPRCGTEPYERTVDAVADWGMLTVEHPLCPGRWAKNQPGKPYPNPGGPPRPSADDAIPGPFRPHQHSGRPLRRHRRAQRSRRVLPNLGQRISRRPSTCQFHVVSPLLSLPMVRPAQRSH